MKAAFSRVELTTLRNDLLDSVLIDSHEAAELVHVFLRSRGYGALPESTLDAVGRVEMSGCSLPVLERELEAIALVM